MNTLCRSEIPADNVHPADHLIVAAHRARRMLLDRRNAEGWWTGRLSTSALSTATAVMALHKAAECYEPHNPDADSRGSDAHGEHRQFRELANRGLSWLAEHQREDGGWGDTILSISNISTTMLAYAVFVATRNLWPAEHQQQFAEVLGRARDFAERSGGVNAVLKRYGRDRTFSVPILMHCALAGIVPWKDVIPLPFELACVPSRFYAAVRMPVVSYALPALIAIGQVIFKHQGHWNPAIRLIRQSAIEPSLRVLNSIQPPNGGFLEATPLTSFVCMSLLGCGLKDHQVTRRCLEFIKSSVRDDGSWPIDTNLATWVTTLSVNGLAGSAAPENTSNAVQPVPSNTSDDVIDRSSGKVILDWLLGQQFKEVHPYTSAAPGGWSWTNLPGSVPDADDTPGAMLAVINLRLLSPAGSNEGQIISEPGNFTQQEQSALQNAATWLLNLQNRDGGWPTFCRGWGTLPFDRSSCDLTAHSIRALRRWLKIRSTDHQLSRDEDRRKRTLAAIHQGLRFLKSSQRADGSWLPLWFGHQFNSDDENPLYGTARVLLALDEYDEIRDSSQFVQKALRWMLDNQNLDGGWSACRGLISSVEETGIAVEALSSEAFLIIPGVREAARRGAEWLAARVNEGTVTQPSPIGFYFAKLWYFEELYPLIFAVAGLTRWMQSNCKAEKS